MTIIIKGVQIDAEKRTAEFPARDGEPGFTRVYNATAAEFSWHISRAIELDDPSLLDGVSYEDEFQSTPPRLNLYAIEQGPHEADARIWSVKNVEAHDPDHRKIVRHLFREAFRAMIGGGVSIYFSDEIGEGT